MLHGYEAYIFKSQLFRFGCSFVKEFLVYICIIYTASKGFEVVRRSEH